MVIETGIILAFLAMFCWGFGDFLIQRSTRKFGDWETLFIISIFGAIVLFPFVAKDLPGLFSSQYKNLLILFGASFILLIAALLEFEALKKGKISVVEPIWSLEVIISAVLAFLIIKESVGITQIVLIASLIIGLVLVSLRSYHLEKRIWLEKGVILAVLSAFAMGAANFFVGLGARLTDALVVNWFLSIFLTVVCAVYIFSQNGFTRMWTDLSKNKKHLITMCILDNAAWVAFAYAMVLAPIAIAVAISESYIISPARNVY